MLSVNIADGTPAETVDNGDGGTPTQSSFPTSYLVMGVVVFCAAVITAVVIAVMIRKCKQGEYATNIA